MPEAVAAADSLAKGAPETAAAVDSANTGRAALLAQLSHLAPAGLLSWMQGHRAPDETDLLCVVMRAETGRWHTAPCEAPGVPPACQLTAARCADGGCGTAGGVDAPHWVVVPQESAGPCGAGHECCPAGYTFAHPTNGRDNAWLRAAMQSAGVSEAYLPLQGPSFAARL